MNASGGHLPGETRIPAGFVRVKAPAADMGIASLLEQTSRNLVCLLLRLAATVGYTGVVAPPTAAAIYVDVRLLCCPLVVLLYLDSV